MKTILDKRQLHLTILRLAHQLLENHLQLDEVVFIGLQPRGVQVSKRIVDNVRTLCKGENVQYGKDYLYTEEFLDEINKNLQKSLKI